MKKTINISFHYTEFENLDDLSPEDKDLVIAARETALKAYAPYSNFRVGAVIRMESGILVHGANVENAASPTGICAERNALSHSIVNYGGDAPVAIAIAAISQEGLTDEPVPPCGNCRQFFAEEEIRTGKKTRVIISGKNRIIVLESMTSLLPLQFNKNILKGDLP